MAPSSETLGDARPYTPKSWREKFAPRTIIAGILTCIGYYLGAKLGFALTFHPHPVSVMWPPNSILLAALLLTPTRLWWFLLLCALPAHLASQMQSGVPPTMMLCWFVSNTCEALIGASLTRAMVAGPFRFVSLRNVSVYLICGVFLGPLLSSFLDAAFVRLNHWGQGSYGEIWRIRFFSNALTAAALVPALVTCLSSDFESIRQAGRARYFEGAAIAVGLLVVGFEVFVKFGAGTESVPALLYAPLPFLLWAAVRFGVGGASMVMFVTALIAIWGASHGQGPFSARQAEANALALQIFLMVVAIPLMLLAAVVQEEKRSKEALRENEAELLRGRAELKDLLRFERLSTDISSTLMHAPPEELGKQIVPAMGQMAQLLGFDVATLALFTGDGAALLPYVWSEPDTPGLPTNLTDKDFPWMTRELFAGHDVQICTLDDFPPEAKSDRATYERYGLKSSLDLPVFVSGRPVGVLSMGSFRKEQSVPPQLVERQRVLGDLFGNALVRARSEIALRESERRLTLAATAGDLGLWFWNWQSEALWATDRAKKMFGFAPESKLTYEMLYARVHPEDRPAMDAGVAGALSGEANYEAEYRICLPDGAEKWIATRGEVAFENGSRPVSMTGIVSDITDRKRAEDRLRESEARFRTVADAAPALIWMSGLDRRCTFFNRPWLEFTGRTFEQELGNGWAEGVHPADLAGCMKHYVESFDARRPFTREYRLRRHDGEYRWLSDSGVPRYDSERNFLGYIGSCVDLTERKQAEAEAQRGRAELAHATRVSTLGALAGSLAHELNQPLTAILSNAQAGSRFLANPVPNVAEVREVLQDIAQDTKRAGEVIRQMRKLVKKDDPQFEALDLNEVIHDVVRLLHSDTVIRNINIVLSLQTGLRPVRGDAVQLQQVLLNLLLNAFDAMKDVPKSEGAICVRTGQTDAGPVQIEVSDRGTGVHPEKLTRIFEPFETTKPHGLGLGLSISRSIVEAHGGRLWVENNTDRGATFCFTVPVEGDRAERVQGSGFKKNDGAVQER